MLEKYYFKTLQHHNHFALLFEYFFFLISGWHRVFGNFKMSFKLVSHHFFAKNMAYYVPVRFSNILEHLCDSKYHRRRRSST